MLVFPQRTRANKDFGAGKKQLSLAVGKARKTMEKGCRVQSALTPACGSSPAWLPGLLELDPTLERSQAIRRHWLPYPARDRRNVSNARALIPAPCMASCPVRAGKGFRERCGLTPGSKPLHPPSRGENRKGRSLWIERKSLIKYQNTNK